MFYNANTNTRPCQLKRENVDPLQNGGERNITGILLPIMFGVWGLLLHKIHNRFMEIFEQEAEDIIKTA